MRDRALTDLDTEIEEMERAISTPIKEPTQEPETKQSKEEEPIAQSVITPDSNKLQQELETAQKRFNNYKGSTDVTIRNLRNELETLRSQVTNLHSENANLKQSKSPSKSVSSYFSQEDREILGETTVEALDKSVNDIVNSKVSPLQEELKRERLSKIEANKREAKRIRKESQELFEHKLSQAVPDYQEILSDKGFRLGWIKDIDPLSGRSREDLFMRAEREGDVGRIALFFNEYRALTSTKISALEEHVVPTGVTGDTPPAKGQAESQINEQFIDKFYEDLSRGNIKYKGKKGRELAEKIEGQIDRWVQDQFRH